MSDKLILLQELLKHIDEYVDTHNKSDIRSFSVYLKDKMFEVPLKTDKDRKLSEKEYLDYKSIPEVEFSTLVTNLYRFANRYVKQVFRNSPFKTMDEFGFLATLLKEDHMSKSELINRHLIEITTGTELIKRLIGKGLIYEYADEEDKRSKQVRLTDKGRLSIVQVFAELFQVSKLIRGNLSDKELGDAIALMTKLSEFHQHIFDHDRNSALTDLYSAYLS